MLNRLKLLPWRSLLLVAAFTTAIATVLEFVILWCFVQVPAIESAFAPVALLLPILATIGVGALGVYVLEKWQTQVIINVASLWALVPCLLLGLLIKSLLPLHSWLLDFSQTALISIVVGVFWKGRPYWR